MLVYQTALEPIECSERETRRVLVGKRTFTSDCVTVISYGIIQPAVHANSTSCFSR